ncbi:DnaA N-terminal domain-containing protein [uncultured Roseobacter sp.]|uniref:DnaA N-terminal domain-containing protein n=1 Tax=uncultured Roseobacter sp. TaxID=114847 RepID=UPI002634430A|nr:DnaA N-terminal domain-containing protein [uncultured Roseobacter sp.]
MEPLRLTGPGASVVKYDVLTALSVAGLNGSPTFQTSMMRLIALVTARYNWALDELCVGQRDMARMWSVNERTVKREVKRLTGAGVLICTRPGVRGRVGAFRLNHARIAEVSAPCWGLVGPDFEARMAERHSQPSVKIVQLQSYRQDSAETPAPVSGGTPWGRVMADLSAQHPSAFGSWFSRLTFQECRAGVLALSAPSTFVQRYIETHLIAPLIAAAELEFGPLDRIEFRD